MEFKVHDEEIHLQKFWKHSSPAKLNLTTLTGMKVEVFYVGRENLDAGPDFTDAIIKMDGRVLKGDIEVHLNATGWYEHGHHRDPAYNNVILHIISEAAGDEPFIEREDGVKIHQVHLQVAPEHQIWQKPETGPVTQAGLIVDDCPLSRTSEAKIQATINLAGEKRLNEKIAQMREGWPNLSWDQLIYKKVLEALGYSKNQLPFRKLADLVPYETVCTEMQWVAEEMAEKKCAAMLFGAAGLLPSQSHLQPANLDAGTLD